MEKIAKSWMWMEQLERIGVEMDWLNKRYLYLQVEFMFLYMLKMSTCFPLTNSGLTRTSSKTVACEKKSVYFVILLFPAISIPWRDRTIKHSVFVSPSESRYSRCSPDDHSCSWRGDRFLQTLHVFGNLHHDQKATEIQTRSLLLSGPTGLWNLDVHCLCLYRS